MKRTKKVLKYVTQSQLSECLNIAIDGDIPMAADLLRIALFPDVILLDQEDVIELMKDLVAEATDQNSTVTKTKFKVGDQVYFFREGRLQCYPISGIEIGPDPDLVTYTVTVHTYCRSIPEKDLFKTLEEAQQDLVNFFKELNLPYI